MCEIANAEDIRGQGGDNCNNHPVFMPRVVFTHQTLPGKMPYPD